MTGMIDWAASRARMVVAFVVLSVVIGAAAYVGLPKEGEPDIDIPGLFVSVPFPGISAEDSERLLVRPMEAEFQDLDGLTTISATAAENYAGVFLEFEFGWDKDATIAEVREAMDTAEANFPDGAESYTINEINFSEFPIIIVALSGDAPERTLLRLSRRAAGPAGGAAADPRGRPCRWPRRDGRGGDRPAGAGGLQRHRAGPDQRGRQQQPADRCGRGRPTRARSRSRSRRASTPPRISTACRSPSTATGW